VLGSNVPDISWIDVRKSEAPASIVRSVIAQEFLPAFATRDVPARYERLQTFRILSPVRDGSQGTVSLNAMVREILEANKVMERRVFWPDGLLVMVSVNDYGARLYNGDIGLVGADETGRPRIHFPDSERAGMRSIAPVRLPPHEPAFAMTVHKSQGSEFDHVLVVLPEKDSPILTRELLYTAITRARKKVTLVGDPEIFARAVARRIERGSGLGKRLREFG
jgi:exodeoxyribonuclease V alpha subunit